MSERSDRTLSRMALLFVLLGLAIQLGTTVFWSPLSFVIFAVVGIPLVLVGVAAFFRVIWRELRRKGAI